MRVIIGGSRNCNNHHLLADAIEESGFQITHILSGNAQGFDQMAIEWADENNIDVYMYPADHKKWGKNANQKRIKQMTANADALIAVWDGESRGTKVLISEAYHRGLKVHVKSYHAFHSPNPNDIKKNKDHQ